MREPTSLPRPAAGGLHYAFIIVLLGTLTITGAQGFLRFGYAMILPSMRDALGLNYAQTGMLATASYIGYLLAAALAGVLVVRFGSRRTIGVGAVVAGVAMFLTGTVRDYEVALVLQLVAGGAGAAAISPTMSLAAPWFAPRQRGRAAGAMSAGGPLGSLITGPLMPALILAFGPLGWRYGWFLLGAMVMAVGLLDLAFLRNRPADVGLAPFGDVANATPAARAPKARLRDAYGSPLVWYLAGLGFLSTLGAISFNTFFAAYLVGEQGLSAETTGQLWAFSGAMGIIGGFLWGGISDRVGRKYALFGAYLVQTVCFALFAAGGGVLVFALCAFLYGITARANFSVMAAYCGDLLGPRLAAAAFGINGTLAGAGMAVGPAVAGLIADNTASFALAFWLSAGIALLGALGSLPLRERPLAARRD